MLFRCQRQPEVGSYLVLVYTFTNCVAGAQTGSRLYVTLVSRAGVPFGGFSEIPRNAAAALGEKSEMVLCVGQALIGRQLKLRQPLVLPTSANADKTKSEWTSSVFQFLRRERQIHSKSQ